MLKLSTIRFSLFAAVPSASTIIDTQFAILRRWKMPWTKTFLTGFILFLGLQIAGRADPIAYMVTTDKDFGTIDLATGDFTSEGFEGVQLAGLGEIGSTLYGVNYAAGTGTLYTIDTANGSLTTVGTDTAVEYEAFGSTLTNLYAIGENNVGAFELYSVNSSDGSPTLLGLTGLTPGGDYTLSTDSSTLYFAEGTNLYTIDTTTGAATLVGPTGGKQFGGLVTETSTLYGGEYNPAFEVDTLNTTSGTATAGPALSGNDPGAGFAGLAGIPPTATTPEPGSVSLLLIGFLAAGIWIKARRQTAADRG
jgi:hypothetical protein